jgi:hypothetical protein
MGDSFYNKEQNEENVGRIIVLYDLKQAIQTNDKLPKTTDSVDLKPCKHGAILFPKEVCKKCKEEKKQ